MPENEQQLAIAHSIILIETLGLVCVADREMDGKNKNRNIFYLKKMMVKLKLFLIIHQ
jgi:hypothetical protein